MEKANLREAHLEETDLREAHLEKANLYLARLAGADLSWASLDGTECIRTDLSKANLFHTRNWPKRSLSALPLRGLPLTKTYNGQRGSTRRPPALSQAARMATLSRPGLATSNDAVQAEPKRASAGSEPTDANTT